MIIETIKKDRKIVAFIGSNNGKIFYAFGKPSQANYISFETSSVEKAKELINLHSNNL
jgi:hypothetical protein